MLGLYVLLAVAVVAAATWDVARRRLAAAKVDDRAAIDARLDAAERRTADALASAEAKLSQRIAAVENRTNQIANARQLNGLRGRRAG